MIDPADSLSDTSARPAVLHVLEAVRGGTSRHVADIVRHTPGFAHHVAVPPADRPGGATGGAIYDRAAVSRMEADGAVVHRVDMRRQPWHPVNLRALPKLRFLAGSIDARVIHGHSSVGGALARIAGRRARLPVVYTSNGVAMSALYRSIERALGSLTSVWIAVSPSEAALATRARLARPDRIVVVPNGIDLGPLPPATTDLRQAFALDPATRLVGTVARLVPQKAPVTFVQTAARVAGQVADTHFILIGMGPMQAKVDAEVARRRLDSRWHQIEHLDEAASVLAQLDAFVLASAFEGAPYTPLEAMRAGVPVVVTDVVGSRDAVEDGLSGLVCPAGDVEALAEAVVRVLSDVNLRRRLTASASDRLADLFDVEKMGRRLADVYTATINSRQIA